MSDRKAINKAIAEACGWTCYEGRWHDPDRNREDDGDEPPNFMGDLNWCAEMQNTLTNVQRCAFGDELNAIINAFTSDYYEGWVAESGAFSAGIFDASNATAPQRCAAFIKAKRLSVG